MMIIPGVSRYRIYPAGKGEIWLRATVQEKLNFSYSIDGDTWQEMKLTLDASIISDDYVCNKFEYKAAPIRAFIGMCCQDVRTGQMGLF